MPKSLCSKTKKAQFLAHNISSNNSIDASTDVKDAEEIDIIKTQKKSQLHINVSEIMSTENLQIPLNMRVIPVEKKLKKRENA